jgi:hypothetical protein
MYDVLEKIESRLYKAIIECNFDSANSFCYCYNIVAIEAEIDKRALLYKVNAEIRWEYKIMTTAEYYKYIIEH